MTTPDPAGEQELWAVDTPDGNWYCLKLSVNGVLGKVIADGLSHLTAFELAKTHNDAIRALTLVRSSTLAEAAKVARGHQGAGMDHVSTHPSCGESIARAIERLEGRTK